MTQPILPKTPLRTPDQISDYLAEAVDEADLIARINQLREWGVIAEDQETFDRYFNALSPFISTYQTRQEAIKAEEEAETREIEQRKTMDFIKGGRWKTPQELTDKIASLDIPQKDKADLFDQYITPYREKQRTGAYGKNLDTITANNRLNAYWQYLTPEEKDLVSRMSTPEIMSSAEQAKLSPGFKLADMYQPMQGEGYANSLLDTVQQRMRDQYAQGVERSKGLLNAFSGVRSGLPLNPDIQTVPTFEGSGRDAVKGFVEGLGGTVGTQGTRLRSFIESKIPEVLESQADARNRWWDIVGSGKKVSESYGEAINRLEQQSQRMRDIMESAPSDATVGNVYWGEGGPAAVARAAFERAQGELSGLNPADFPEQTDYAPSAKRDPLIDALRARNWRAEYNRQPGVGINSRLAPAIRWR